MLRIFGPTVIEFFGVRSLSRLILMDGFNAVAPGAVKATEGNVSAGISMTRPSGGHIPLGIGDRLTEIGIEIDAIAIVLMAGSIATARKH